jgi:predicted ATPase
MHELLRQFAAVRLDEVGQTDALARRHPVYYLRLAEQAEAALFGPQQVAWFDHLEADLDNLNIALAWSLSSGQTEVGLRLAATLGWFWFFRAHLIENSEQRRRMKGWQNDGLN